MTAYRRAVVIEHEGNGVLRLNVEKAEGSIMWEKKSNLPMLHTYISEDSD